VPEIAGTRACSIVKKYAVQLATAVTLAAAVAVLPSCSGNDDIRHRAKRVSHRPASVVNYAVGALAPDYAILRRVGTSRDILPPGLISKRAATHFGLDTRKAHMAYASPVGKFYVVPSARGFICILGTDQVIGQCWPWRTVATGSAVSSSFCSPLLPKEIEMVGMVPDGVGTVSLIGEDGSRKRVAVRGNVFVARMRFSSSLPARVAWRRNGMTHDGLAGISPTVVREACA
jgi:hypothetical protein